MKRIVLTAMVACLAAMWGGTAMGHSTKDSLILNKIFAEIKTQLVEMRKRQACGISDNSLAILATNVLTRQNTTSMKKMLKEKLTLQIQETGCEYPTTKAVLQ